MTYDEYKAIGGKFDPLKPETGTITISELLEKAKEIFDEWDASTAKITEQADKIRELQDTNARLFLKVTGNSETPPEDHEKTTEELFEEFRTRTLEALKKG